jgi:hypothetical protein
MGCCHSKGYDGVQVEDDYGRCCPGQDRIKSMGEDEDAVKTTLHPFEFGELTVDISLVVLTHIQRIKQAVFSLLFSSMKHLK